MNLAAVFSALLILQQSFEVEAVNVHFIKGILETQSSHNFPEVTQLVRKKTGITYWKAFTPVLRFSSTVDNVPWCTTIHKLHVQGQELFKNYAEFGRIALLCLQNAFRQASVPSGESLIRREGWCTGRSTLSCNPSYDCSSLWQKTNFWVVTAFKFHQAQASHL